jgi:hypothetical protein
VNSALKEIPEFREPGRQFTPQASAGLTDWPGTGSTLLLSRNRTSVPALPIIWTTPEA